MTSGRYRCRCGWVHGPEMSCAPGRVLPRFVEMLARSGALGIGAAARSRGAPPVTDLLERRAVRPAGGSTAAAGRSGAAPPAAVGGTPKQMAVLEESLRGLARELPVDRRDGRWSDPLPLVVATDRRGGTPYDDNSLDPAGVDTSCFDGRLLWSHERHHAIGRVDAFAVEGDQLVALVRLDCSTDRGRWADAEHRAGAELHASVAVDVLDRDERWWPRATHWLLKDVSLVPPGTGVDPAAVTAAWRL